ncbi:hypothetical protein NC652_038528 [Populus alba x Populus x berolinensis]|nr:hypothetical protein NC652_038528 [Populus alba x Populus x berolinensis]
MRLAAVACGSFPFVATYCHKKPSISTLELHADTELLNIYQYNSVTGLECDIAVLKQAMSQLKSKHVRTCISTTPYVDSVLKVYSFFASGQGSTSKIQAGLPGLDTMAATPPKPLLYLATIY